MSQNLQATRKTLSVKYSGAKISEFLWQCKFVFGLLYSFAVIVDVGTLLNFAPVEVLVFSEANF